MRILFWIWWEFLFPINFGYGASVGYEYTIAASNCNSHAIRNPVDVVWETIDGIEYLFVLEYECGRITSWFDNEKKSPSNIVIDIMRSGTQMTFFNKMIFVTEFNPNRVSRWQIRDLLNTWDEQTAFVALQGVVTGDNTGPLYDDFHELTGIASVYNFRIDRHYVFISDSHNNRVIAYFVSALDDTPFTPDAGHNAEKAEVIFGIDGLGSSLDQLNNPGQLAIGEIDTVDPSSWVIYVLDTNNHRIVKGRFHFSSHIDHPHFSRVSLEVVFGSSGTPGCELGQLRYPKGIFYENGNLWVSDTGNHRVLQKKEDKNNPNILPRVVAGQCCCGAVDPATGVLVGGSSDYELNEPRGIVFNNGNLFIADSLNHRVLRFSNPQNFTNHPMLEGQSQFNCAYGAECIVNIINLINHVPEGPQVIPIQLNNNSTCGGECTAPHWKGLRSPQRSYGTYSDLVNFGKILGPLTRDSTEIGTVGLCMTYSTPVCGADVSYCAPVDPCADKATDFGNSVLCSFPDSWNYALKQYYWDSSGLVSNMHSFVQDQAERLDSGEINPTVREIDTSTSGGFLIENVGDNYAQRITTIFIPPQDGDYKFRIASRHHSILFMHETLFNPIAEVANESPLVWIKSNSCNDETPPTCGESPQDDFSMESQVSTEQALVKGQLYWIEAWSNHEDGVDFLQVGVEYPDGTSVAKIPSDQSTPKVCYSIEALNGDTYTSDCVAYEKKTGQRCEVYCKPGYHGNGAIFICNGMGEWIGTPPTCEAYDCTDFPIFLGTVTMHGVFGPIHDEIVCAGNDKCPGSWKNYGISGVPFGFQSQTENTEASSVMADTYNHRIVMLRIGAPGLDVIAGGNGPGKELNQLNYPQGVFVSKVVNKIIIADTQNHRVISWTWGATKGVVIAGDPGCEPGSTTSRLKHPSAVFINSDTFELFVVDSGNSRFIKFPWNGTTWATVGVIIEQNTGLMPYALDTMVDGDGNMFFADHSNVRMQYCPRTASYKCNGLTCYTDTELQCSLVHAEYF